MQRILVLQGEESELLPIRELAIEAGLGAYWVREKRAKPSFNARRRNGPKPVRETRLGLLLLNEMRTRPNAEWSTENLGIHAEQHGYMASSVSPSLSKMAQQGDVVRMGEKAYRLTEKGRR